MAKYKKESLEGLLKLIEEICDDSDNQWFVERIAKITVQDENENNSFPSLIRFLKSEYKKKGSKFYHSITDKKLKNDLINDFNEMYFNHSLNNMGKFIQFTCFQMENLLNYYCIKSNAYEKIRLNKNYYAKSYNEKFEIKCFQSFFGNDIEKEIGSVNLWAKITYWIIENNKSDWYLSNSFTLSNIINIRNHISHRNTLNTNDSNKKSIETLKNSDLSALSFYLNVLREIINSINNIKIDIIVRDQTVSNERFILPGIKEVGRIDLTNYEKDNKRFSKK